MHNQCMRLIRLTSLLVALLPCLTLADGPKAGIYKVTFNLYISVDTTITLTPAKNGQFTAAGTMRAKDVEKRRKENSFVISGTVNKKGQLRAKARIPGSNNEGQTLDGHWDEAADTLVITKYGSMEVNWPMKREAAEKPTSNAGFMAGVWSGGSAWGTVTLTGGPTKYEGTYQIGHQGTIRLGVGQTGQLAGKWIGLNGHEGTILVKSMTNSKAWKAKVALIEWTCNKKCDEFCPKQGTSTWIEKK
jgi:hypothetical protein